MWGKQLVEGSKFVMDEPNLIPLLKDMDPREKIIISTIGNGVIQKTNKNPLKRKSMQSLAKLNLGFLILVVLGIFSLSIGCTLLYCSVYEWMLYDLLEMRSISPIYMVWTEPPHMVTFSVNLFEAVNHEEFLASDDPDVVLQMRDIGPVVYREHLKHANVTHHANGTMSYTSVRHVEFLEHRNEPGILNRTIVVPNFGLIGALSFLHELSFFSKLAFNVMLNSASEPIFINITVYDMLWNYKSDVITLANKVLPSLVPVQNLGIMHNIYDNYIDRVNVKIGEGNGFDKFFNMQRYNYEVNVPGFNANHGDCNATIEDSTEGIFYTRYMNNETVIKYFRKSICQVIPLHYEKASVMNGLAVNEFVLHPESMNRKKNLTADCVKGSDGEDIIPDGLTDISKCYFNFPMVLSLPHFYGFENGSWMRRLRGLEPELAKHQSRIYAEPVLGLGVQQYARSQVSTYVKDLSGFPSIFQRFSHMVIPIFWGELMLVEPPPFTLFLMKLVVNYFPFIDYILPLLFIGGGLLLWFYTLKINFRQSPILSIQIPTIKTKAMRRNILQTNLEKQAITTEDN